MLRNYFKIAWRTLSVNKAYTVINITGLAVGIACAIVIFLVVSYERSFDRSQPNYEYIYRVVTTTTYPQGTTYNQGVPFPMRDALRASFPQFREAAVIYSYESSQVDVLDSEGGKPVRRFKEGADRIFFTEPAFFRIFSFRWLAGDPAVLDQPNTVVLSKSTAINYFGSWEKASGKLIGIGNSTLKIAGILDDAPANTDFPLRLVISLKSFAQMRPGYINFTMDNWNGVSSANQCYVLGDASMNASQFNARLFPAFAEKHHKNSQSNVKYSLQPLSEIHFDERFSGGFSRQVVSRETLWALVFTGLFVLAVAAINFINMSTAQGVRRSKEVGVRKTMGAGHSHLAGQFFMEAFLITSFSVLLAVLLTWTGIPLINRYLGLNVSLGAAGSGQIVILLATITLVLSLVSGFYPALVISRRKPVPALRNTFSSYKAGGIRFRSSLVAVQFIIAQMLIFGTLVMASQMKFFRQANLGFDPEAVLNVVIPSDNMHHARLETFRQQLQTLPEVAGVSFSSDAPSSKNSWSDNFRFENENPGFQVNLLWADPDYFQVYRLEMIAGRPLLPSDTLREFVINETLMKKLGFQNPSAMIGKMMKLGGGPGTSYPIVGVVKDFNLHPLTEAMKPLAISTYADYRYLASIRISPNGIGKALSGIEEVWNGLFPDDLFDYTLLGDDISRFYVQEERLARLFRVFCVVILLISCLGVYGLAMFMVARRVKEVGVRKVLGATPSGIVVLFSKSFFWLTLIAFVIAVPLSWWMMEQWLEEFAYRISIDGRIAGTTLLAALSVMLLAISFHATRAALTNPARSLRSE